MPRPPTAEPRSPEAPLPAAAGRIVVMGSGETTPSMVGVHRDVLGRTGPGTAVVLDSPYAFQENAADVTGRTLRYFAQTVGRRVDVARWRRDAPLLEREETLARLVQARWVFAGPGSPTYALRQWRGTPVPEALVDVVRRGGTLVFGSAAAVTMGTHAVPVYEIYKAGADPFWADGLDLLGRLSGIAAAVVPHFDNAEGGTHDTRFCYLGSARLSHLERELPDHVGVLGVDEHTALVLDLAACSAAVFGAGAVTLRRRGGSGVIRAGDVVALPSVVAALRRDPPVVDGSLSVRATPASGPISRAAAAAPSLAARTEHAERAFDRALAGGDVDAAVAAVLGLEADIAAWSTDMLQSDEGERARRALRAMVVRLGRLARIGARDPHEHIAPYVDLLVELRARARAAGDYATADDVRERLRAASVEVRDTADGPRWNLLETRRSHPGP